MATPHKQNHKRTWSTSAEHSRKISRKVYITQDRSRTSSHSLQCNSNPGHTRKFYSNFSPDLIGKAIDSRDAREIIDERKRSAYKEHSQAAEGPPPKRRKWEDASHQAISYENTMSEAEAIHLEKLSKSKKVNEHDITTLIESLTPQSKKLIVPLVQAMCTLLAAMKRGKHIRKQLFQPVPNIKFFHCISAYVCSMPQQRQKHKRNEFALFLSDIVMLFRILLETHPYDAAIHLPIDACCGTVNQLSQQDFLFKEVKEKLASLRTQRDEIRQKLYGTGEPSETILEIATLPSMEELHTQIPTLKENIVVGQFPSVADYLSIFNSLLREDFIQPLREALKKIESEKQLVFENVSFTSYNVVDNRIMCSLKFATKKKIKWQYSKRFTYGNLLCLSEDNFATVIFATVADRNIDDLKDNILQVKLIGKAVEDPRCVSPSKVYRMIESPCYYEAYAPVVQTLQNLNPDSLPFKEYFVQCVTDIKKPLYLRDQSHAKLNLHGVVCKCALKDCEHKLLPINEIEQKKLIDPHCTYMDSSQSEALCTALTRELVLIQGPPGTGKTYIGLKIVQSLMMNKSLWAHGEQQPIMIVCYTNHALDQFLEGLIHLKKDFSETLEIRRLGGRSKSKEVEPYNIKKFVDIEKRINGIRFTPTNHLVNMQNKLKYLEEFLNGIFTPSNSCARMYSYFLSEDMIEEMRWYRGMENIICPNFFKWGLLYKEIDEELYHDSIKADRDVMFGDEQKPINLIYEEESLRQFVCFFRHEIHSLSKRQAEEFINPFEVLEVVDDRLHLRFFKYCLEKLRDDWKKETEQTEKINADNSKRLDLIRIRLLQRADVIGITVTGAAKYNAVLNQVQSKICIIEEAGEVMEPHVISTLTQHSQHLILIGDHKQLRPKTNSDDIGRKYKLNISLFERLITNDFPVITLRVQHRMRPEISRIVSKNIYDGCLQDSESVLKYENVKGMKHNLYFVNHEQGEVQDEDSTTPHNAHEASFIKHLCNYLIQNGHDPEKITVITPYLGQQRELKRQINGKVRVSTIDNYQGEENDIVLLSLVRSNKSGYVGFTRFNNRVCVAMSRAKIGFYCIGNFEMFISKSQLWKAIVSDLKEQDPPLLSDALPLQCETHKNVTLVSNEADFINVPSGGCGKPCRIRLPECNHACDRLCHPDDPSHQKPCQQLCPKRCTKDLHRCRGVCGKECPPCTELIETKMPYCKHIQQVPCNVQATKFSCMMPCEEELPCSHPCKLTCGEECGSQLCKFLVMKKWPCGHEAQKECHTTDWNYSLSCKYQCNATLLCGHKCSGTCGKCRQGRLHVPCAEKCTRTLICGHPCKEPCTKNCAPCTENCKFKCVHASCGKKCSIPCKPCPHPCEWQCEHFKCTRNCGEPCDRKRCSKPCKKVLPCKHNCIGLCGEPCPSVCRICNKDSDVFEIFFGDENEDDSRFVLLADCNHIIEANALDQWMDTSSTDANMEIDWKRCPKCKEPVITTLRYADQTKKVVDSMNQVKKQQSCFYSESERQQNYMKAKELSENVEKSLETCDIEKSIRETLTTRVQRFKNIVDRLPIDVMLQAIIVVLNCLYQSLQTIEKLAKFYREVNDHDLSSSVSNLRSQAKDFLEWVTKNLNRKHFTDQMLHDSTTEAQRLFLLGELYFIKHTINTCDTKLSESELKILETYQKKNECLGCLPEDTISEDNFHQVLTKIRTISKKLRIPLTKDEKVMIIKAIQAKPGSWYQCQNGHFYQIGECGGAMETSQCPECSEVIGGASHTLAAGNQHAGEFDGSSHAAWSEGANLANFDLRGLN